MGCFTKTNEWFVKQKNAEVEDYKNRPRNICNPDPTLLGVCNHVNNVLLTALK